MRTSIAINSGQRDSTTKLRCVVNTLDRRRSSNSKLCKPVCWLLASLVLYSGAGHPVKAADDKSTPEIDTATTQRSEKGRYKVSFDSVAGPIVINAIHEWRLTVITTDGRPVDGLTIDIEGGMPTHNHGLPTAPRVTESLGEGQYRVEGFKFQMPGHWTTTFNLTNDENFSDSVTFNLML